MVGAILIGDKTEFTEFKDLIEQGTELSEKRLELLRSGKKAQPVLGKLICSCNQVGEGNIENKISEGCTQFKALCQVYRRRPGLRQLQTGGAEDTCPEP